MSKRRFAVLEEINTQIQTVFPQTSDLVKQEAVER